MFQLSNEVVAARFADMAAMERGQFAARSGELAAGDSGSMLQRALRRVAQAAISSGESPGALSALEELIDLPVPAITQAINSIYSSRPDRQNLSRIVALLEHQRELMRNLGAALYRQAELKAALISLFSTSEAAAIFGRFLGDDAAPSVQEFEIENMWDYFSKMPETLLIFPAESFTIKDPDIFGKGASGKTTAHGRNIFIGQAKNAIVRHRSSFVEVGNHLLLDVQDPEWDAIQLLLGFDPAILNSDGRTVARIGRHVVEPIRLTEAIHLGGATSHAFGHWILEYLPKLAGAIRAGILPEAPILVDAGMPPSHYQALRMLCGPEVEIIELGDAMEAHVSRLWVLGTWSYIPVCPQPGQNLGPEYLSAPVVPFADLARWTAEQISTPSSPSRKLFLARRSHQHRKLINQDEIAKVAEGLGFRVVYLEEYDFAEQMALIRGADALAGPEGSSFLLGFFSKPGTKITILNHPFVENLGFLTSILEEREIDPVLVEGRCVRYDERYQRFSDYEIDRDVFVQAVER